MDEAAAILGKVSGKRERESRWEVCVCVSVEERKIKKKRER